MSAYIIVASKTLAERLGRLGSVGRGVSAPSQVYRSEAPQDRLSLGLAPLSLGRFVASVKPGPLEKGLKEF